MAGRPMIPGQIELAGTKLRLIYRLVTGVWTLESVPSQPVWHCEATAGVHVITPMGVEEQRDLSDATLVDYQDRTAGDGTRWLAVSRAWPDGLIVCQQFVLAPAADEIQIELRLRPPRGFASALRQLIPLRPTASDRPNLQLSTGPDGWQVFDLGWASDEPARVVPLTTNAAITTTGLAALVSRGGSQVTLAFLDASQAIGQFAFRSDGISGALHLSAAADFGTVDLHGDELSSGPLWLSLREMPGVLARFVELWREVHPTAKSRAGFVQWLPTDCNEGNGLPVSCDERVILDRLAVLASWPAAREIDVVTLPSEWAQKPGDWWADPERFPHGERVVAEVIRRQELCPGVVFAPLLVDQTSSLFQNHPTWLVRAPTGDPVVVSDGSTFGEDLFVLDPSQPAVREWLATLGQRLVSERFGVLQLDKLAVSVVSGWHAVGSISPLAAFSQTLGLLSKDLDSCTLVAAAAPLLASLEPADVLVAGAQPLSRADPSPLLRAFLGMTGRTLGAGPLLLDAESQSLDEARAAATVACFAGGAMTLVGDLSALSAERNAIVRVCLPPFPGAVLPRDLGTPGAPRVFATPVHTDWDEWLIVLAVNPSTAPICLIQSLAELGLPPGGYHAFEFWTQSYLGVLGKRLIVEQIPPGGCAVVGLKELKDQPQLVGTSLHVSLGATTIKSASYKPAARCLEMAVGSAGDREGTLTVTLPRGWSAGSIRGTGGDFAVRMVEERLAQIWLRFRDVADIAVDFWGE
ncbi:MAG TPA: alpha-galactosidase [Chloroflexota bacterium]|nr:alpha-galactosidase [Chloroflexota bacterium]